MKFNRNLGASDIKRRRRDSDPMRTYDTLPLPLRRWLSEACLPWSPKSARRIWEGARAKGLGVEETLIALSQAEARTLARDAQAASQNSHPKAVRN